MNNQLRTKLESLIKKLQFDNDDRAIKLNSNIMDKHSIELLGIEFKENLKLIRKLKNIL